MTGKTFNRRPRPPRQRSDYRNVADLGDHPEPIEIEPFCLRPDQIANLQSVLGKRADNDLDLGVWLEHIASQYLCWRKQPQPSKSVAKFQIELLAHLARKLDDQQASEDQVRQDMMQSVMGLNGLAHSMLWYAIENHSDWPNIIAGLDVAGGKTAFEYLTQEDIDLTFIGQCAQSLLPVSSRGDYPDMDLALTVQDLVAFYEKYTGGWATYSTLGKRRNKSNEPGSAPASACSLFTIAFFGIVDPRMAPSKPANSLKKYLSSRRSRSTPSQGPARHVPNLLRP
ncbi:hypothetical protein [Parasphingorhabdus sp.]|uniref:hypothetical protein n=1 Tax=Parasphingorhabdus sp. TaxID=2709688 RepID=UPI00300357ED